MLFGVTHLKITVGGVLRIFFPPHQCPWECKSLDTTGGILGLFALDPREEAQTLSYCFATYPPGPWTS